MLSNSSEFAPVLSRLALFGDSALRFVRKLPTLFLRVGLAVILGVAARGPVSANEPMRPSSGATETAPTLDAIAQNTPGGSEAFPAGVPSTYAWCSGAYKPPQGSAPPSNFTAVTALGTIYPTFGAPAHSSPDARIIVANAKTYVHLRANKEWNLVQDQSEDEITGAQFAATGARNTATEMKIETQPNGVIVIDNPPPGRNGVLWIAKRGAYAAGSVDAVYVQMDMKTTDPKLRLVANVGAVWWRDPDAAVEPGSVSNQGAGNSNWLELSTDWSTLIFFSGDPSELRADPPPPLAETANSVKPTSARRTANMPSPCLRPVPRQRP
jgi:hypothetical protein